MTLVIRLYPFNIFYIRTDINIQKDNGFLNHSGGKIVSG